MSDETADTVFLRLSRVLTGESRLSAGLAREYYLRIQRAFPTQIEPLLNTFDGLSSDEAQIVAEVRQQIMDDGELGAVAREIIMLWYLSGFRGPDQDGVVKELGPETPEQYFQGLLWPTIRAHPLGLSGGYFGYWHYPPEN